MVGPLAAVMVIEKSPAGTPPLVTRVSVVGVVTPAPRLTMGLDSVALTPAGRPETLRPTGPVKPFREARNMSVEEEPCTGTVMSGVPGVIEKSVRTSPTPAALKVRPLIPMTNMKTDPGERLGLALTISVEDPV